MQSVQKSGVPRLEEPRFLMYNVAVTRYLQFLM